ncbi:multisubunit sodium/proton antiporter, MrpG subunit [Terribacillus aidingensis]|uniref:Multisubunit sodium/proton antiporter, MrpG subunit n=1 Tax=Terribacillus aidingensis TaxID=586416 RepID=A0A285NU14_9BACI|nr:monovalent cation/H(+) antiporter subunit G [Terribacillus aidingensis]SNZ11141.1 multisubunit sodium/proton antiporter, MrpG subunit [Terribacillus aidingensis]
MIQTIIEIILDVLVILLLLGGAFIVFTASVGVLRFPDIYTRLHAASKGSTLGVAGILIGAFIFHYMEYGIVSGRLILGVLFIMLTAPVASHLISRAAHLRGAKPYGTLKDQYQEAIDAEKRKQDKNAK